jgi:hypothetical protein
METYKECVRIVETALNLLPPNHLPGDRVRYRDGSEGVVDGVQVTRVVSMQADDGPHISALEGDFSALQEAEDEG